MAAVDTSSPVSPYDSVIEDIQLKFQGLRDILTRREYTIINHIMCKREEHLAHCSRNQSKIQDLLNLKSFIEKDIKDNAIMKKKISEITLDISNLESETAMEQINPVSWGGMCYKSLYDIVAIIDFMNVATQTNSSFEYKKKTKPIFQGGYFSESSAPDHLSRPNHLAIDESTQNVYISDFNQQCIFLFDGSANFVSKFNSGIKFPRAITCRNSKLYLIENSHSMQHLQFKTFGLCPRLSLLPAKKLKPPSELSRVSAFDVSEREIWYICNREKSTVFCLSKDTFNLFPVSSPIQHPTAIKVCDVIYLLESHSNESARIKLLTLQGVRIRVIPLCMVCEPLYFDIDLDRNFIVSDSYQDSVIVFENDGSLLHRILSSSSQPIAHPKGIAVNKKRNIIVVTNNPKGCLLIF